MKGGRGRVAFLGLALVASAAPAFAGTIYRCDGADGIPSYVSKRVPGASCVVVSSYRPAPAPSRPAPAGTGSASPANPVAGAVASTGGATGGTAPATFMGGTTAAAAPVAASASALPRASSAPAGGSRRLQQGQVYSYIKDGVRHYTSARPRGGEGVSAVRTINYSFFETCYACGAAPGVDFGNVRLNTTAYSAEVSAAARKFGVDEAIVRAIMHAESAFNPNALSRAGAQGLMQLMPATARRFGVTNAFDPVQNIHGGVEYLAWLLKRFNGDLTLASAGYNAGEGAVDRHGGVPPYNETQRYVQRVAVLAERYRGQQVAAN
jgi:soluble lytic murein transglycosylase-like protein